MLAPQVRTCYACNQELPLVAFSVHRKGDKLYRNRRCNKCRASRQRTSPHVTKKFEMVRAAKQRPCVCCGGVFVPQVMELRHRDPSTKRATITQAAYWMSVGMLAAELEKCDPLCSNCARAKEQGILANPELAAAQTDVAPVVLDVTK